VKLGSPHLGISQFMIMSILAEGEKTMITHAFHEIFLSKPMFVAAGGFIVWGAILVAMLFDPGTTSIGNISF
jgi:hypothetical protein